PPPRVHPHRVCDSECTNVVHPGPVMHIVSSTVCFSCAQAAPPSTYSKARSTAPPSRPVMVPSASTLVLHELKVTKVEPKVAKPKGQSAPLLPFRSAQLASASMPSTTQPDCKL